MVLEECKSVEEKPLKLLDVPKPVPARNEVRIKIKACGVCHTDLHTVEGELPLPKLPIVPGHEVVGIVDELGEECYRYKKGERVGVAWLYSSCGLCKFCKMGLENLCENAKFTGLHANGGYEEYMVVREDYAYPIPDIFSDENAAPLLCAGVIGYRSFRHSNVKPGQKLGLFGFGASAHIVIQLANILGCDVYVFTRSEKHREHARKLGAKWVGDARDASPEKLDSAIIFAPAGWIVREALKSIDRAGTLVINAIHMSPIPELPYDLLWHERKIASVANVTREDAEQFLKIAGRIPIRTEVRSFKLEEANVAMQLMKKSEIEGAAVLRIE
ncbi:MAG: zinc-dependent alcohol dehydrogenase family protein [Methanomassiliicoccales archaeon]|jgi:propanol-preferring alcohol dehydrogenase|nr:zinc-dependent alcohol dehydrogenase family protein [Methanomassiliicoccales archaeon]